MTEDSSNIDKSNGAKLTDEANKKLEGLTSFVRSSMPNLIYEIKKVIENYPFLDVEWGVNESPNEGRFWILNDDDDEDSEERTILDFWGAGIYNELPKEIAEEAVAHLEHDSIPALVESKIWLMYTDYENWNIWTQHHDDLITHQGEILHEFEEQFESCAAVSRGDKSAWEQGEVEEIVYLRIRVEIGREAIKKHNQAEELNQLVSEITNKIKPFLRLYNKTVQTRRW
jgi:hypothetical protein